MFLTSSKRNRRRVNRPPSPPSLPLIGHLHLLKEPLHRTLQHLSNHYGPIYSISMGVRNALVVSSPSIAEECFTKNDAVFANRPDFFLGKILHYNYPTIASAPSGPLWRSLRRLLTSEFLSTAAVNSSHHIRQDEVKLLLQDLFEVSEPGSDFSKVDIRSRISGLTMNIIMRMVSGKRYYGAGKGFQQVIKEVSDVLSSATSTPGDFLPMLRRCFDFGGTEKRIRKAHAMSDSFLQDLVNQHRKSNKAYNTMIDVMLYLQESEPQTYYGDDVIKGMILIMIIVGMGTFSVMMEWAMSLTLNHPEVLNKAKAELDKVVRNNRLVEESDYPKLPYLQHIIKETLRLYPVTPLLVPHQSSEDCNVHGYHIPKGTMLIVNAYAIQRDPKLWEDPTSFRPERHDDELLVGENDDDDDDDDVEGYNKMLPFGIGRRSCPGSVLANRVMGLVLGSLIQCFEWRSISDELVDMSEGQGLTMPKAEPLEGLCKPRTSMRNVLVFL
ncbi:Cytochrome P450 81Q32 [Linum perenne]